MDRAFTMRIINLVKTLLKLNVWTMTTNNSVEVVISSRRHTQSCESARQHTQSSEKTRQQTLCRVTLDGIVCAAWFKYKFLPPGGQVAHTVLPGWLLFLMALFLPPDSYISDT